jgi:hypothetical protein
VTPSGVHLVREIQTSQGRATMLRYPIHGSAKRVEDTATRAMTILRAQEMKITKPDPPTSNLDILQALATWKGPAFVRWQCHALHCHLFRETADRQARSQVSPGTGTSYDPEKVSRVPVQPSGDCFQKRRLRPDGGTKIGEFAVREMPQIVNSLVITLADGQASFGSSTLSSSPQSSHVPSAGAEII